MSDTVFIVLVIFVGVVCLVGGAIILSGRDTVGGDVALEEWRASRDGRKK